MSQQKLNSGHTSESQFDPLLLSLSHAAYFALQCTLQLWVSTAMQNEQHGTEPPDRQTCGFHCWAVHVIVRCNVAAVCCAGQD